jgi:hypothetical protein
MKTLIAITIALLLCAAPAFADYEQTTGDDNANAQAASGSAASVTMGDTNNVYEGNDRGLNGVAAPAGEINYPGMAGRFDAPPERYGYMNHMKVKDILEYDEGGLTIDMAEQMRDDESFNGKRILVRPKFGILQEKQRLAKDVPMKVHFEKAEGMQSLGVITIVSDSKKSISPDVFAEAQIRAWELGATELHIKAEGFQREVHTSGAGIGFTWSGVTVDGNSTKAMTGVLGAGKSWGQAGYYDHPFITIVPLAPKNIKYSGIGYRSVNIMRYLKDNPVF